MVVYWLTGSSLSGVLSVAADSVDGFGPQIETYGIEGWYSSGVQQRRRASMSPRSSICVGLRLDDGPKARCAEFGERRGLAANPPGLGGRIQTRMDFAQRTWTQPAVLLATRNA
jgi:hypothetical protein